VTSHPEDGTGPAQAGAGGRYSVDAPGGLGVQVGEGNTQIIYSYNRLTWTDGVAPPPLVSVSGVVDSPYRGLGAFEEQDAALFFGREAATTQLLQRMSRSLAGAGLLVVSGVSGAGKSSLLRAGMLPRIRGVGLASAPGSAAWPCLVFTPTRDPLDELALRVAALAGADAAAVRRGLDTDPERFALTARQAALAPPPGPGRDLEGPRSERQQQPQQRRLLLVVDQFEQVFTQCPDEGQRTGFITALCAAADGRREPHDIPAALVVLGVRADFEARCANYPQLAGAVQDRYLVTAMTERQLRLAITEPAKKVGSRVDDDLVEVLLADVRTRQPGAAGAGVLPLLSHALDQAWRSRAGESLTLADYERTGGIEGAVADSAQRAYDHLTPAQQAAARQVFTRLTINTEGVDTADRATRAELTEGKSAAEAREVDAVLEAFAAERLLTLAADSVEISHETLPAAWPLLRDTWLTETHADRIVRTRLHNVAAEWARQSHDPSYLYRGSLLQAANETAARIGADPARNPPLSQTERDFLSASGRAHRRRARRRQAVIAGLLALTLTAITTAGLAMYNAANTTRQHAIALSRQLAAESLSIDPTDPVTARRLAVAAWRVYHTDQAGYAMTTLLGEQQQNGILLADPLDTGFGGVNGVTFSPDGRLLAGAEGAGSVRLWDPATGRPVRVLHATSGIYEGVLGVAFSPDGKLLASADADGTVRLLDPATGQPVRVLRGSPKGLYPGISEVAFSPDGKLLASADADLTVRLWDPVTGRQVRVLHAPLTGFFPGVNGVAFSPSGRLLASAGGDGTVRLWNLATGRQVRVLHATVTRVSQGVFGVAFSPSGKLLATAGGDGTVRLWNPITGRQVRVLHAASSANAVKGVAFSPDGELLASAGSDGTVRLWDPVTGQALSVPLHIPATALTPGGGLEGVAFSPDGKLLAGADADGTVRLLDPATGQPVGASFSTGATGPFSGVSGVEYSPDGKLLATAGGDGTVRLWDLATSRPVRVLRVPPAGPYNAVEGVAFSPDGKLLADAGEGGTVQLWDAATGQLVHLLHVSRVGYNVWGVAFSPDGRLLASAGVSVRLWNPVTGQQIRILYAYRDNASFGVAFSPDGRLLASAGSDGTVRLWDPVTGQQIRVLHAPRKPNGVSGVAFSPDGRLLASAGSDGTVRLWDPVTGQQIRVLHAASKSNGVGWVAFSTDGKLLASVSGPGVVRLWDPATGQARGVPFGLVNAASGVSRAVFSPDGELLASADSGGTVRFWKVSAFINPYAALCADVGAPTQQEWKRYAAGESQPGVCV
jgi:WD40 repeat protein